MHMISGTKAKWQLGEEFLFLHGSSITQVGERFTLKRGGLRPLGLLHVPRRSLILEVNALLLTFRHAVAPSLLPSKARAETVTRGGARRVGADLIVVGVRNLFVVHGLNITFHVDEVTCAVN